MTESTKFGTVFGKVVDALETLQTNQERGRVLEACRILYPVGRATEAPAVSKAVSPGTMSEKIMAVMNGRPMGISDIMRATGLTHRGSVAATMHPLVISGHVKKLGRGLWRKSEVPSPIQPTKKHNGRRYYRVDPSKGHAATVIQCLRTGVTHVKDMVRATDVPMNTLSSAITCLLRSKHIVRVSKGTYKLAHA